MKGFENSIVKEDENSWRDLEATAVTDAARAVEEQIPLYEKQPLNLQIHELQTFIDNLPAANDNRYVAKKVGEEIAILSYEEQIFALRQRQARLEGFSGKYRERDAA